jgi:hypothetical protein
LLSDKIKELYKITNDLETRYPGRKFTPDGHLVGSIGEVLVAEHYDLTLLPNSSETHDAVSKNGTFVQIKATQISRIAISSEPEYLISCMNRQLDWGVVVCLVGNGQAINKGEAGLTEWIESISRSYKDWEVYMSEYLLQSGDISRTELELVKKQLKPREDLHLKMSMRSFRSEKVSIFVNQLLALQKEEATETLKELENYPIVLTRSLDKAKQWLREHARGSERFGLLASSKAERLKAISINVRYQPDFVHWFLEDDTDIRSSNALEDTLTEFKVQGLEIDWACVAWDADLRLNKEQTAWQHHQLRSGTKWQNINKPINQQYQINAYRVLLTRARQGMVIVVPNGDNGVPPDETRKPEWYDSIYNYLKEIGVNEI